MKHWASSLIGKPWVKGGEGPDAFDCWGLCRWVFRERHQVEMPMIYIGANENSPENVAAIIRAAQVSGFRRAYPPYRDGDIMLMDGPDGRHVGLVIDTLRGLRFLHAAGRDTEVGPVGSVVAEQISAVLKRYNHPEIWRKS